MLTSGRARPLALNSGKRIEARRPSEPGGSRMSEEEACCDGYRAADDVMFGRQEQHIAAIGSMSGSFLHSAEQEGGGQYWQCCAGWSCLSSSFPHCEPVRGWKLAVCQTRSPRRCLDSEIVPIAAYTLTACRTRSVFPNSFM